MAIAYPERVYPLGSSGFNGEYIHTSFLNYRASISNGNFSNDIDFEERLKKDFFSLIYEQVLAEEEKILAKVELVDKTYYKILKGEKLLVNNFSMQVDRMIKQAMSEVDLSQLQQSAKTPQNIKKNLLTERNIRKISSSMTRGIEDLLSTFENANQNTPQEIKEIISKMKSFRAEFNSSARIARKKNDGIMQEEVLENYRRQLVGLTQDQIIFLTKDVEKQMSKDMTRKQLKSKYRRGFSIPKANVVKNSNKTKIKKMELRNYLIKNLDQNYMRENLLKDEHFKYILGNANRFHFLGMTESSYIKSLTEEIYLEYSKPLIFSYGSKLKRSGLFRLSEGKIIRKSSLIKDLIDKSMFNLDLELEFNISRGSFKSFDKEKSFVVKPLEPTDETFYRKRLPISQRKFNSILSAMQFKIIMKGV